MKSNRSKVEDQCIQLTKRKNKRFLSEKKPEASKVRALNSRESQDTRPSILEVMNKLKETTKKRNKITRNLGLVANPALSRV